MVNVKILVRAFFKVKKVWHTGGSCPAGLHNSNFKTLSPIDKWKVDKVSALFQQWDDYSSEQTCYVKAINQF